MKQILATAVVLVSVLGAAQANTEATGAAGAAKAAPAPTKAEILARGQQIAGSVCVACHGLDGASPINANPNIGGMPDQYIAKQLELFKTGARKNPIMQGMAANLSADDMKALGVYYFAQSPKTSAVARNAADAARGQKIFRAGIADAKVPACAGCHGGTGAGIPAIYPRLAGQWPEYTLSALKAYSSGERKNTQMNAIASRMRDAEMAAAAEYIAGMRTR